MAGWTPEGPPQHQLGTAGAQPEPRKTIGLAGVHDDADSLSPLEQLEAGLGTTDIHRELAVKQLRCKELGSKNWAAVKGHPSHGWKWLPDQGEQPRDHILMPGWTLQGPPPAQSGNHITPAPPLTTFGLDFLGCAARAVPYTAFALPEHGVAFALPKRGVEVALPKQGVHAPAWTCNGGRASGILGEMSALNPLNPEP